MHRILAITAVLLVIVIMVQPVSCTGESSRVLEYTPDTPAALPVWSDVIRGNDIMVACSADCRNLVAGSDLGIVRIYDRTGKRIWEYEDRNQSFSSVSISGEGDVAAAAFFKPYNKDPLFFARNGTVLSILPEGFGQPKNVAIAKKGKIVLASAGRELSWLDMGGATISQVTLPEPVCRNAVSDDGTTSVSSLANSCSWRRIRILSVTDITGKPHFSYATDYGIMGFGISGNGSVIAGVDEYRLYVFHRNGTPLWNYTSSPQFRSVGVSSDGQYIAAGSQYFLRFFTSDGKLLWTYYDRSGWVRAVSVSDTGDFVFIWMSKEPLQDELLLFNRNGSQLWHYTAPSPIRSISSSGDGKYFAAARTNHVYFFNRQGDATVPDTPDYPDIPAGTLLPGRVTAPQPTTKSSPVCWPVYSIAGCGVIAILRRRRSVLLPLDEA